MKEERRRGRGRKRGKEEKGRGRGRKGEKEERRKEREEKKRRRGGGREEKKRGGGEEEEARDRGGECKGREAEAGDWPWRGEGPEWDPLNTHDDTMLTRKDSSLIKPLCKQYTFVETREKKTIKKNKKQGTKQQDKDITQ